MLHAAAPANTPAAKQSPGTANSDGGKLNASTVRSLGKAVIPDLPDLSIGEINPLDPHRAHSCASDTGLQCDATQRSKWVSKQIYTLIPNRLSFTPHDNDDQTIEEIKKYPKLFFFSTDSQERYLPFCADFGPVNIGTLVHFCRSLRNREADKRLANRHLVYYFTNDSDSASNVAFLLSAYLMLEHNFSVEQALRPFTDLAGSPIVPFRDATFTKSTFPLTVKDCLNGLERARQHGWFDLHSFDVDEYEELDSPDCGDMHMICPKFVAFRGPDERPYLNSRLMVDNTTALHPKAYALMFKRMGVRTVVRLNDPETYKKEIFEADGFKHFDLFFGDCTTPSDELVCKFLKQCDETDGVVAVHCLAGLGRTGTMIGVWLMKNCGFTAKEAIAWMRLVRPGCVIGRQQHFLEWMEARIGLGVFPPEQDEDEDELEARDTRRREDAASMDRAMQMKLHVGDRPDEQAENLARSVEIAMKDRASVKRRVLNPLRRG